MSDSAAQEHERKRRGPQGAGRPGWTWLGCLLLPLACGARTPLEAVRVEESGGAGGDPLSCREREVVSERLPPTLMFLIDRSGSMVLSFAEGLSRWDVLKNALGGALPPVDADMAMGVLLFPSVKHGGIVIGECNILPSTIVEPALGNTSAMLSLMNEVGVEGLTPTAEAVEMGAKILLEEKAASTARALILVTDGLPNCNSALPKDTCPCTVSPGPQGCDSNLCLDSDRAVSRLASYRAQGIPTYVLGIQVGDGSDDVANLAVLDAMADAGGRAQVGAAHRFYAASTAPEMSASLTKIRDQVGCTFRVPAVTAPAGGSLRVTLGSMEIPYEPGGESGWSWGDQARGELLLRGEACKRSGSGEVPVVREVCPAAP